MFECIVNIVMERTSTEVPALSVTRRRFYLEVGAAEVFTSSNSGGRGGSRDQFAEVIVLALHILL